MNNCILEVQNFINGHFCKSDQFIESIDPSTGKTWVKVPDSGKSEMEKAVEAAEYGFKIWSKTSPVERAKILYRISDIIESRLEEFAQAESKDQGKPLWQARTIDIPRAVLNLRHFATTVQSDKEIAVIQPEIGVLNYTVSSPVGVVGIITPWNLPLYLLTFKLAPALAHGNTVVAKPSELTSVTAWMLCSVFKEAGLPPGVVNMVFGYGSTVGELLAKHPNVKAISFTGSTITGKRISQITAPYMKKLSLEMGGKNAAIVFEDADLEKCIPTLIRASFLNQGEVCLCTSRIYVQRSVFEVFVQEFVKETIKKIKVGAPSAPDTWMGPLISKQHMEKVKNYLKVAEKEGATFLCGGLDVELDLPPENQNGYFISATVLTNLPDMSFCMQEEIFGPVTCVVPFDTEEEVISRANNVQYGLCASVWSKDVSRIYRLAQEMEVGTVWCNTWLIRNLHMPFGGVKMSGVGFEGSDASREFYTVKKTVCVKTY
ncbi:2-aminomuconic semialdehyde dehydrogenase-like [Tachypleus tridentatus]|uniref:2-aminomuconic semialdehyde dehydrogenase-like n=1 Tax=Tachypleus tridentatus TaxID=6853 RepID=UPI003FD2D039